MGSHNSTITCLVLNIEKIAIHSIFIYIYIYIPVLIECAEFITSIYSICYVLGIHLDDYVSVDAICSTLYIHTCLIFVNNIDVCGNIKHQSIIIFLCYLRWISLPLALSGYFATHSKTAKRRDQTWLVFVVYLSQGSRTNCEHNTITHYLKNI